MPKQSKKSLDQYMKRDVSWLAKKLFEAREENERLSERIIGLISEKGSLETQAHCIAMLNTNMAAVLMDRGLMPTQLVINYRVQDCDHCPNFIDNDCLESWPDEEDDWCSEVCKMKTNVRMEGFWTFSTDMNSVFDGITSMFEKFRCKAESIATTDGRILWKSSQEGSEKP